MTWATLNQTALYALRAMVHLACMGAGEPVNSKELGEATSVPVHYLSKIMRRMVTAGLVESRRGHGGGFYLALPLEEIRFADILGALGPGTDPHLCAFGWGQCNETAPCPLHEVWSELNRNFETWANRCTLAQVCAARSGGPNEESEAGQS